MHCECAHLVPRLRLTVTERAVYSHLVRHSRLEGKLRAGMRAGGLPYGYRPISGKPGEHVVYEPEAEIVRRIFLEYAKGSTPRQIAHGLNQDKIPPIRGRA